MTGIERLRAFARRMDELSVWPGGTKLLDIADQIEREHECERDTIENLRLELGEARDDAAWVRAHGGLERVKDLLNWVVGHCSTKQQLDFDFWLSGRVMHELGFEEDMADRDEVEGRLLARLVPEGMEWLLEVWPKFEDDAPVKLGDMALIDGDADMVEAVQIWIHGKPVIYGDNGSQQLEKAERVRRPAVPASDGEPLEAGQTVWHVATGREYTVRSCTNGGAHLSRDGKPAGYCRAEYLTHQHPVLDADGVPIREGDTVYEVGEKYTPFTVLRLPEANEYQSVKIEYPNGTYTWRDPVRLTHTKPEIDSLERIADEIDRLREEVALHLGDYLYDSDGNDSIQFSMECVAKRCRALAERERGE